MTPTSGLLGAGAAGAAVLGRPDQPLLFGAASSASSGPAVASLTWAHTVGPFSNGILVVGVSLLNALGQSVTGITYGGHPLTKLDAVANGVLMRAELWYLVAPPAGSANVVASFSLAVSCAAGATSWFGARQGIPFRADYVATGQGSSISVPVSPQPGDKMLDHLAIGTSAQVHQAAAQNLRYQTGSATLTANGSSAPSTVASMSWTTMAVAPWAFIAAVLEPALLLAVRGDDSALASDSAELSGQPAPAADAALSSDSASGHVGLQARTAADAALSSDSPRPSAQPRSAADAALASDAGGAATIAQVASKSGFLGLGFNGNDLLGGATSLAETGSAADSALAGDAAGRAAAFVRTASDAAAATDAATRTLVLPRAVSDSAVAVETLTRLVVLARSIADTAFSWDSAGEFQPAIALVTTSGVLGHLVFGWWVFGNEDIYIRGRQAADASAASDAATARYIPGRLAADLAIEVDTAAHYNPFARSASDSALAADLATRAFSRVVADAAASSDAASAASRLPRSASDSALAGDAAGAHVAPGRMGQDSALAADAAVRALIRQADDSALAADAAVRALLEARSASDAALAADLAAIAAFRPGRSALDSALAADASVVSHFTSSADSALAADAASRAFVIARISADSALAADGAGALLRPGRVGADAAHATDAAVVSHASSAADAALAVDAAARAFAIARGGADASLAADAAATHLTPGRTVLDLATAADSALILIARTAHDAALASDGGAARQGVTAADLAAAVDFAFGGGPPRRVQMTWVFGASVARWEFGTAVTSVRPLAGSRR